MHPGVLGGTCWNFPGFTSALPAFQVVEVGHFWGYRTDEKSAELLRKLTAEMNQLELAPLPAHPQPDLVCLAPFADFDKENYFRAQILYVSGNSAEVCFFITNHSKGKEIVYKLLCKLIW